MNEKSLKKLISLGEGHNLEFKQAMPDDLGRELCAFANSAGGMILIGVADDGTIKKPAGINRLSSQVQDHARNCDPPIIVETEAVDGVIVVTVKSSRHKPHSSKGIFYLREGANSQRMSRSQIRDFFFKEGLLYFDAAINPNFRMKTDFIAARYTKFARDAGIDPEMEPVDVLRNLGILTDEGMTNAGALILGQPATRYLVSASVTCVLFQGTDKVKVLDQKVFEDEVSSNFHNAMIYLQSHLNTEYIISSDRKHKLELPESALREALINAIAHRDYRSSANVQVYIFSDRVEIVNPGGLVGGLELKDLGKRSAPRNPLLFGILYRMKLVEHVGSGIRRIKSALAKADLPEPILDVDNNWFSITFVRTASIGGQKSTQKSGQKSTQKIIEFMKENPSITIAELAGLVGIVESAIKKNIAALQKDGRVKRIGPDKGGHWEVQS